MWFRRQLAPSDAGKFENLERIQKSGFQQFSKAIKANKYNTAKTISSQRRNCSQQVRCIAAAAAGML